MANSFIETNNCLSLLSNEQSFLLKVSSDQNTLGEITWHSRNTPSVLNFKDLDTKIIGHKIDILIPKPFHAEHLNAMKRWVIHPSAKRFSTLSAVYLENFLGECYRALLYLKILPVEAGY